MYCTQAAQLSANDLGGLERWSSESFRQQTNNVAQWCKVTMNQEGRKEGSVLFNDALNTFYLRLYGVRLMVKDHSDC